MAQIGAFLYICWGLLHLSAASKVYKLGARQAAGMVQARLYQAAWNLAFFAVAVAVVAVVYNWNNSPAGYWLNLGTDSNRALSPAVTGRAAMDRPVSAAARRPRTGSVR